MSDPLEDFFKQEETTMIFDMSNIAHTTLHAVIYTAKEDNGKFDLWKYAFINCLFSNIQNFDPNKVIFACDFPHSNWRYDVYKDYKWERKIKKETSEIQYDKFYEVFNEILEDIKNTFTNIVLLKENRCEADDIISVLSRKIEDDKITIVSSDKDFHQLLTSQRIRQFKPITKDFVECINPHKSLQLKILTGDKGDSIPPVRPKVGPKTAAKILESGLEEFLKTDPILQTNYDRNKQLIDLKEIPLDIQQTIINSFTTYDVRPIDPSIVFKFFNKHRLRRIMDQWNIIGEKIKKLHNYGQKSQLPLIAENNQ